MPSPTLSTQAPPGAEAPAAPGMNRGVEVVTLGCRLNDYESEVIRAHALAAGHDDLVVVNTCAVTNEAVRQARQTIRRLRAERPEAHLVVTGCAAQIDPAAFAAIEGVDRVIGNAEKLAADTWARSRLLHANARVMVDDIMSVRETAAHLIEGLSGRTRAWIQVQNGCDHRCTFCIIPFGRGPSRSVPAGEVVQQVRLLAARGVPEVVLTGVDLTSWGTDLPGTPRLGNLVRRILRLVPELQALRLSSIDAAEMDDDLLRAFAEEGRLTPFAHLSLQHGDDLILKRMKRRHSRASALALIGALRAARPDIALGADLIAGFPTESEDAHAANLSLIAEAGLAFVHVFPFSARDGTPAARMPRLRGDVVRARAAALRGGAQAALVRHLEAHLRRPAPQEVLVEREGTGRLADFTPVGGAVLSAPGARVRVRLSGHDGTRLVASKVA
jgi:threonylcarbamoyladenosine tRNA methylthiotransferase MtaB